MTRVARYCCRYSNVRDLDMTPAFIMVFYIAIASRYIACGNGDDVLYSLSGVAVALFLGVRFFVGRLR